jgi:hypothetical protein
MPQTSAPRKPGAGMMMQQTQPKLQQQHSIIPPSNLEDIDDEEDFKASDALLALKDK